MTGPTLTEAQAEAIHEWWTTRGARLPELRALVDRLIADAVQAAEERGWNRGLGDGQAAIDKAYAKGLAEASAWAEPLGESLSRERALEADLAALRARIEALCDEYDVKAAALAAEDDWGESISDTVTADAMRGVARHFRALADPETTDD